MYGIEILSCYLKSFRGNYVGIEYAEEEGRLGKERRVYLQLF